MVPLRTEIEKALDEISSYEDGMRFQGLAVVLAKQRWPGFIACERKKDFGLDAHMPASLAPDGIGKGLASSVTGTLDKIKDDARKVQTHFEDVKTLIFATPVKVTNQKAKPWIETIGEEYGYQLIVMSREDIITDLMLPSNASICQSHLNILIPSEPSVEELLQNVRVAVSEVVAAWLAHPRLTGRPKIELQAIKLDQEGRDTGERLGLASLATSLLESRRIVLEAPAGRGKTTTLVQLAERQNDRGELLFLIDLPAWVTSRSDILEYIAKAPAFRSRCIEPKGLAKLYGHVHFSFLLNGWNEIADSYSEEAKQSLLDLERNFPKAGIIVATRTHHIQPPLPGSFRVKLLPLTRRQRTEYVRSALGSRADELARQLDSVRILDDLTRTPLFLAGVTTIFLSGDPIPKTRLGVLGGMIRLVEDSEEHRDHLGRPPLMGHSRDYLTALTSQMMIQGSVTLEESRARSIIHSASLRLTAGGQIVTLPEPAAILSQLCAHHVLERIQYPSLSFRYEHQQFQEYYAAMDLKRQLSDLIGRDNSDENQRFSEEYVNKPVWEEALRMVAEEIGELSVSPDHGADSVSAGRRLIEFALGIDPVLAADLSRLCGSAVWREVRGVLGECLRSWYKIANEHHQRCALAGILATGSEDFVDILLPLITCDDQQVRLHTYRAWGEFHVSSLGKDWRQVVKLWKEEHRADFIREVVRERWMVDIAEEFARTDPSETVRTAAIHALRWLGASDALSRVMAALNDTEFEKLLRGQLLHDIPVELQPRALATYQRLLRTQEEPQERLRNWLGAGEVGGQRLLQGVKEELDRWPPGKIDDNHQWLLKSALNLVKKSDPNWVSHWVAGHIVDGSLWRDYWITFVSTIPGALKRELLEKLSAEGLEHPETQRAVSILAATADADLAEEVFSRLCKLRGEISTAQPKKGESLWIISRQLEGLFRAMPLNLAVSGLLNHLSAKFDTVEFEAVIDLFGGMSGEDSSMRAQIEDGLRQRLRKYLKDGLPFALSRDDFNGHLKAHLAMALGKVGDPDDMNDLHNLIRADIERLRRGRAAWLRGRRDLLANGATMVWGHWHMEAVAFLNSNRGQDLLLEILREPEYEQDAATALIRLAMVRNSEAWAGFKRLDYRVVWDARSGRRPSKFDKDRRHRFAIAIKQRISAIMDERSKSDNPDLYNGRLKELAKRIAVLDGRGSTELVMEIMILPCQWDYWTRVDAIEALLFSGAQLHAERTLNVLNPTIAHALSHSYYDQQATYLLQRCLCLLPFVDSPSTGIARIKEVVAAAPGLRHELREIVVAIGHSRSKEGLDYLLELPTVLGNRFKAIAGEWINAMAALNAPESKRVLLSFVDPDLEHLGIEHHFEYHDRDRLTSHIADIARAEAGVKERIFLLCSIELSQGIRLQLAEVVARLGTPDALLAGLDLIRDGANPPIPYHLTPVHENVFLEQRPYGTGGSYTLVPRSANKIRSRLFEMIFNDDTRRHSAWALLGQIESLRLEYGRPSDELRHPAFDSGKPWPPIKALGALDKEWSLGQQASRT